MSTIKRSSERSDVDIFNIMTKTLNQPEHLNLPEVLKQVGRWDRNASASDPTVDTLILRNYTLEGLKPFLKYHYYQSALRPQITFGGYDTIAEDVLTSNPIQRPDLVVLSLRLETFAPDLDRPDISPADLAQRLFALYDTVAARFDGPIVVNTFLPPFYPQYGLSAGDYPTSTEYKVHVLNNEIRNYVVRHAQGFVVSDWVRLLMRLGRDRCLDDRFWYMARAPFKPDFLREYAADIACVARALKGRTKKCLVLDCDNTLWGGVVGEVGLAGLQLDPHEYPGAVYYRFQKNVLSLHDRGVLILLCSKNNEDDVWRVLENHPSCLLKKHHISGWRINWSDKAANLRELAEELNLSLDSFVFVDDSPFECELVGRLLPEVTVCPVPRCLTEYPDLPFRTGWFDQLSGTNIDRRRTEMVRREADRRWLREQLPDLESYLASLEIRADIHGLRRDEIPRVAQLTQKTNQFNLTTRRYSEAQIQTFARSEQTRIFTLTVSDKFGPSGLTGVFIATCHNGIADIDTFLLSCRVLGRRLEDVFTVHCLDRLTRLWRLRQWTAAYFPTSKNHQVADFWDRFGFDPKPDDNGAKQYTVPADRLTLPRIPFIMVRSNNEPD